MYCKECCTAPSPRGVTTARTHCTNASHEHGTNLLFSNQLIRDFVVRGDTFLLHFFANLHREMPQTL